MTCNVDPSIEVNKHSQLGTSRLMLGQIIAQREAAGLPMDVVPEKVTWMLSCHCIADRSITESPRGK
jgi:hypothetical protein